MKSPVVKLSTLILFFGAIGFFVACKAGYFDGKPSKTKMSSSKSGAVISPEDTDSMDVAELDSQQLHILSSSKSGVIFNNKDWRLPKAPQSNTDSLTVDAIKSGKYSRPTAAEIKRLEEEVKQERVFISSSKVMIIEHKRLDQLIDSLTFMRKLDSLFRVVDKQKKKK